MHKTAHIGNTKPKAASNKRKRKAATRAGYNLPLKRQKKDQSSAFKRKLLMASLEILCLGITAILIIMILLGYSANRLTGTSFFSNLLPFAVGVLALIVAACIFIIGWWKLRKWLQLHSELWTPMLSIVLALLLASSVTHDQFAQAYGNFRTLVGGKKEAGRVTLAHQVYAAYRRHNLTQLQKMIGRAQAYQQAIEDASKAFGVDVQLLQGIAAAESSFIPRNSHDGGRGLFQITHPPKTAVDQTFKQLNTDRLSLNNPRHNAFIAAATFKHYLSEMKGDPFLGLLAYNIGPANGGLRFIMQQYGATDFITVQPYLQTLPRDYPIRVLSYALAFRLWQKEGKLLAYEKDNNAIHIQRIGIPGLHTEL
ncbi:lytic transglycosylase domain-containing protein [Nitrosomonas aestuarii]|uniref:lytic transglycosylase domain-containing protein n=1 Tax=Nitrosomonas aestuarii TaxID=52441 RepID=UPI000D3161D2|nr:transglycosylase SLT domain-containing protein [Nitrosomonas aestuarii]PTN09143.1 transglycosylase-like protein with SLT domain [Nitrosomonas aestuarii]